MSGHGDEPELTKAVPLVSDATGVIPVGSDPETGELGPIDAAKIANLASGSAHLVVRRGAMEGMQFPLLPNEPMTIALTIRYDNAIQTPIGTGLGTAVGRIAGLPAGAITG